MADLVFIYDTSQAPHLDTSPERFTAATIALFSASQHTHRALVVVCDSEYFLGEVGGGGGGGGGTVCVCVWGGGSVSSTHLCLF